MANKRYRPESHTKTLNFLKEVCDTWSVDRRRVYEFTFYDIGRLMVAPFDSSLFKMEDEELHLLMVEADFEDGVPGKGGFLLGLLLAAADLNKVKVTLTAMKLFPHVRINRLKQWYKKNGFKRYDGLHDGEMTRYPIDRFKVWTE